MKMLSIIFALLLVSCVYVHAADIAFYVGQWNLDGWYGAEQFDDVATIKKVAGGLFEKIIDFDDDHLDEFGAWAEARIDDDKLDIIWLNGCTPSCLYPFPNAEPDGSVIERWLDGGNMVINVGDWFAYCSYEGGGRQADNGGTGAANILDLAAGIIFSAGDTQMKVTDAGRKYIPSLNDPCKTDRPVSITQVQDPWEVAAAFATPSGDEDGVSADPIVIHNTETDGYMAFVNQAAGGPGGWVDDRGQVCAEFILNWVGETIGLTPVEFAGKLSTTWGEIK